MGKMRSKCLCLSRFDLTRLERRLESGRQKKKQKQNKCVYVVIIVVTTFVMKTIIIKRKCSIPNMCGVCSCSSVFAYRPIQHLTSCLNF